MISKIKKFRRYQNIFRERRSSPYRVYVVSDNKLLYAAKRLHSSIYVELGYNTIEELTRQGHLNKKVDPHQFHSQYFVVTKESGRKKAVVATARQILAHEEKGHNSFQTYQDLSIYKSVRKAIDKLAPEECVEISGLARSGKSSSTYATFLLYRLMWQHSLKEGHKLWLMSCDVALLERLKYLFDDALVQVGKPKYYKGHHVVPVVLEVERSLEILVKASKTLNPLKRALKREMISFFLRGLPESILRQKFPENEWVIDFRRAAKAKDA